VCVWTYSTATTTHGHHPNQVVLQCVNLVTSETQSKFCGRTGETETIYTASGGTNMN